MIYVTLAAQIPSGISGVPQRCLPYSLGHREQGFLAIGTVIAEAIRLRRRGGRERAPAGGKAAGARQLARPARTAEG